MRTLRSWVLDEMPAPNVRELDKTEHRKARRVAVSLDRVGYMVKQRLIPDDALFEWQQDEIQLLWRKLEPIVKNVRITRNRPNYCKHFEYLMKQWLPRMKKRKKRKK